MVSRIRWTVKHAGTIADSTSNLYTSTSVSSKSSELTSEGSSERCEASGDSEIVHFVIAASTDGSTTSNDGLDDDMKEHSTPKDQGLRESGENIDNIRTVERCFTDCEIIVDGITYQLENGSQQSFEQVFFAFFSDAHHYSERTKGKGGRNWIWTLKPS